MIGVGNCEYAHVNTIESETLKVKHCLEHSMYWKRVVNTIAG